MGFNVVRAGLCSLLVDLGRPDRRELGVPVGGAADRAAYRLGNALMGTASNAAALEITLAGPTLEATAAHAGVVFGSEAVVTINGKAWPTGLTFQLEAGDSLAIGAAINGARTHLCVAGGFEAPLLLGSQSAFSRITSDTHLKAPASRLRSRRRLAKPWSEPDARILRVLPGSHLTADTKSLLETTTLTVSDECDRQGVRLMSDSALLSWPEELVSAPVASGTVQLPPGGNPIVLGVDAQTIGGYPRLAHVIQADLDKIAQLRPGDHVRLRWVELAQAETAWHEREVRLRELEAWLTAGAST